jgi:hypothetical protein
MPIYTLETGDGRRLKIEADTPDAATAEANAWASANPVKPKESYISELAGNIGPSAVEYGKALVEPILSPIETAKAVGQIGAGLYSKAAGALGAKQNPEEKAQKESVVNAMKDFYGERYGSWSKIAETAKKDPVGLAGDFSAIFTLGGGAAARLPGMAGKAGQIAARVGEVTDPLTAARKAASGTAGLLGKTTSEVTGLSAGTGAAPIELAYQAGREGMADFRPSMSGKIEPAEAFTRAQAGIEGIVEQRNANYVANLDNFKNDKKVIDPNEIKQTIDELKEVTSPRNFIRYENAESARQEVLSTFDRWSNSEGNKFNPINFDDFKRSLNGIRAKYKGDKQAELIIGKTYDKVVNTIEKNAPGYANWMKGYGEMSDLVDEITKTFSLGGNPDTAIRKLQSVMRNNVNTNYGQRKKLIDVLAEYEPSLPGLLAGQALSSWTPRGLAGQATRLQGAAAGLLGAGGVVSPGAALLAVPALAASSPRVLGETAYGAGRVAAGLNAIPSIPRPALAGSVQVGRAKQELERLAQESAGLLGQ